MLKIKLFRTGKKGQAQYRIVVSEAREKVGGNVAEYLGTYDPHATPPKAILDLEKYQSWLQKGAQPTNTVRNFVAKLQSK